MRIYETADAVELILDTQRPEMNAKTLTKCRVLLSRLEWLLKREMRTFDWLKDDSSSGVNRRHLAPDKKIAATARTKSNPARDDYGRQTRSPKEPILV